jgi:ribosomal-protein-serine acetyltransferase
MLAIPPRAQLRARPITSERLSLVPIEAGDAAEIWEVVQSSRAWLQPWLPWVPYQKNVESAHRFAEASANDWDQGRALRFVIRPRRGHDLYGVVGLEACVEMHRSCELGYWLRREHTRRGYMTEAAGTCLDLAFRTIGFHRVRVAAATQNQPSLDVIGRLGFQFEGVARHAEWCDGRWLDHAVFSMLEHEWRGQPPR